MGANTVLPAAGRVFISVADRDKPSIVSVAQRLIESGFSIVATQGTRDFLTEHGVEAESIRKVHEGRPHVEDAIRNRDIALVINTPLDEPSQYDDFVVAASSRHEQRALYDDACRSARGRRGHCGSTAFGTRRERFARLSHLISGMRFYWLILLALAGSSGCVYFNTFYNAQKHFGRLKRAARARGAARRWELEEGATEAYQVPRPQKADQL